MKNRPLFFVFVLKCIIFSQNVFADPSGTSGVPETPTALWNGLQSAIENDALNVTEHITETINFTAFGDPLVELKLISFDLGELDGQNAAGATRNVSPKIAAMYARPVGQTNLPAIVTIHGGGQTSSWQEVYAWAARGYACVSINWGGNPMSTFNNTSLVDGVDYNNTDWDGLAAGFVRSGNDPAVDGVHSSSEEVDADTYSDGNFTLYQNISHPLNAAFNLNSYAARRGITYLEGLSEVDATKIGVVGFSMGGITTTITGTDPRIKCISPAVGGTGWDYENYYGLTTSNKGYNGDPSTFALYQCTVSQEAYWPLIQVPALFLNGTNDFNAPFDAVQRSIDLLPNGVKGVMVNTPHANHIPATTENTSQILWMEQHLKGSFSFPEEPSSSLDLTHVSGIPVFSVTPDPASALTVKEVEVFYGDEYFTLERFWHKAKSVQTTAGTWQAALPVFDKTKPLVAFAKVTYNAGVSITTGLNATNDDFSVTSEVQYVNAGFNGATPFPASIIEDTSRNKTMTSSSDGLEDWHDYQTYGGNFDYGTFKIGSDRYTGPEFVTANKSLEIQITTTASPFTNWVSITMGDSWGFATSGIYRHNVLLTATGTNTITVNPSDFLRVDNGTTPLADWDTVKLMKIQSGALTGVSGAANWSGDKPTIESVSWIDGVYAGGTNFTPSFSADSLTKTGGDPDVAYSGTLSGDATDTEGAVTYTKIAGPAWLQVASNGTLSGTPTTSDSGDNKFLVMAKDASNGTDYAELAITVSGSANNNLTASEVSSAGEFVYESDVSANDLLHGLTPTGSGWISGMAMLNDGIHGRNFVTAGNVVEGAHSAVGAVAEFTLGSGANGLGYDISGIQAIASWSSTFANQAWSVEVKTVGGSWATLDTVDYQPIIDGAAVSSTKVTLANSNSNLATGIDAIRFTTSSVAGSVNAGQFVLREIDVFGTPTASSGGGGGTGTPIKVILLGGQSNSVGQANGNGESIAGVPSTSYTLPTTLLNPQSDIQFYYDSIYGGEALTTLRPGSGGNLGSPSLPAAPADTTMFGPEVSFGRSVADATPSEQYAIIKHGVNGSSLGFNWFQDPAEGPTYTDFQGTVTDGLAALQAAGYTTEIVGMLWMQGETDGLNATFANAYQSRLQNFIANVRGRYGANLPFVMGEVVNSFTINGSDNSATLATVNNALQAVATADANAAFVTTNDLTFTDGIHFDGPSTVTLGERMATAFSGLYSPSSPPQNDGVSSSTELEYQGDVSNTDLLHGLTPVSSGWVSGIQYLNDGQHGASGAPVEGAWTTNGAVAEFTLGSGDNGLGYDVSSIQSIASWSGTGFANQAWTVETKAVGGSWTTLDTVSSSPFDDNSLSGATKVTLENGANALVSGIEAIRFVAATVAGTANGGNFIWREVDVFGASTASGGGAGVSPAQTEESNATSEVQYEADVSNTDLLHGLAGTYTGFTLNANQMSDGIHGRNFVDASSMVEGAYTSPGAVATYTLGSGANGLGYDISAIQSIASWGNTFANQAWTVEVKPLGGNWTTLDTVDYQPIPDGNSSGSTKVVLANGDNSSLATGIEEIRFTANSVTGSSNSGSFVWREVDVFGSSTTGGSTNTVVYSEDFENSSPGSIAVGSAAFEFGWGGTSFVTAPFTSLTIDVAATNSGYSSAVNNIADGGSNPGPFIGGRYYGSMSYNQTAYVDTGVAFSDGISYEFSFLHYQPKNTLLGGRAITAEIYDVSNNTVYATQTFPIVSDLDNPETRTINYTATSASNGNNIGLRLVSDSVDYDDPNTTPTNENNFYGAAIDNIVLSSNGSPPSSGIIVDTVFSSNELAYAGDVSSSDLINGVTASEPGQLYPDPFNKMSYTSALNDGVHGATFDVNNLTAVIATGAVPGSKAEYKLGYGPNGTGYDISSIVSIAAWTGAGFNNQAWTVEVKPVGGDWTELQAVDYQPFDTITIGASKVSLSHSSGTLASGIERIRFTANSVVNVVNSGAFQWREIDVIGSATPAEAVPVLPAVLSYSPNTVIDGTICSNISTQTKLVAKFDEAIQLGTGNITIVNLDTNAQTVITLPNAQVSVDPAEESLLVIEPTAELLENTRYAVRISSTAVDDKSGNSFGGIADNTTWTFATREVEPLKILCIGDSITVGYTEDFVTDTYQFGYRSHLYKLLDDAGYVFQFVGGSTQPWVGSLGGDPTIGGTYKPEFDLRDLGQDFHQGGGGAAIGAIPGYLAGNDADLVLLKVGINSIQLDGNNNYVNTLSQLTTNIFDVAKAVLDTGSEVKLVVAQTIPYVDTQTIRNAQLRDYNAYIRDNLIPDLITAGYDGSRVRTADMYSMFLTDPNDFNSAVAPGRHSNNYNHPWNEAIGGAGYDTMAQQWFDAIDTMDVGPDCYSYWIKNSSYALSLLQQGLTDDSDGDNIPNGIEAFFGTNPSSFNVGLGITSRLGAVGEFTHPHSSDIPSDITGTYEWSIDLVNWYQTDGADGPVSGLNVTASSSNNGVMTTVQATASAPQTQFFLRVKVDQD